MPANFLSDFGTDITLVAGVAKTLDLPVDGARDWRFLLKNTGATNAVTAATIAYSPLGGLFTTAEAFPADIPLAAGATTPIVGISSPIATVRLVLTSTAGTTVRVEGGGR